MTNLAPLFRPDVAAVTIRHPGQFEVRLLCARPLLFLASPAPTAVVTDATAVGFRPASTGPGWVLPL